MKYPFRAFTLGLLGLSLTACAPNSDHQASKAPEQGRAILVSIDSANEEIMRNSLTREQVPAFFEVFENGACTDGVQAAFPSVTAAGHAALWTGTYGNINNISGNAVHPLPRDQHTIMASASGYGVENSSAEPIWTSAGFAGLKVGGHHVTQAPGAPGFPSATGERSEENERARQRVIDGYALENVIVMNGYNDQVQGDGMLRGSNVNWENQPAWSHLDSLNTTVEPQFFSFSNNVGTFYGVVYGTEGYDHIAVNLEPNVQGAIVAYAAETENTPIYERPLARHFSEPLRITHPRGAVFLRLRLFEVAENGRDFLLFHPPMHVIDVNHADARIAYEDYVQGWFGNSATRMYSRGDFGPTFYDGGDGLAEARFLETAELETKLFNRGSEWFWNQQGVDLLVDYFPLGDSIDHTIKAFTYEGFPGFNPEFAKHANALRAATWALVDLRLRHLMTLAEQGDAAVFLVGDHGMRTSWQEFRPNGLLQQAGLQVLDENGMIDLSRSVAASNTGSWITVNTVDFRGGIVPLEEKDDVIEKIVSALESLHDEHGKRVIERVYIAQNHPELGIGGPAGGDVYWAEAHGFRSGREHRSGRAIAPIRLWASHTHASTEPLMKTVTCAWGGGFSANRIPYSRQIDVAPTVADYLDIPPPAQSVGTSLLEALKTISTE